MTEMKTRRDMIKFGIKLALGAVLVYYVLHSKMIDFDALKAALFLPRNLAIAAVFFFVSAACCALRWHLLSQVQNLSLSRFTMFELIMIGNFFNTFMPGSVGGDVIKAWYVAGREPSRKMRAVFTMFLDRVIGLAVIVFYAAVTLVFYAGWLPIHPELKWLAAGIWAFTGASILVGAVFYGLTPKQWHAIENSKALLARWPWAQKLLESTFLYRAHLRVILISLFLSGVSILGMNILYKLVGDQLGIPMDLAHYFFIVPVTMTAAAIPILPGGIGVGQVAFYKLFQWVGMANPQQGATLCTAMQVYTILFNCTGAFFYLKFKRQPLMVESERFAASA